MKSNTANRPNVPVPAPIIMGGFLFLGLLLSRVWPVALEFGLPQLLTGWACIVAATVLLLWCFGLFVSKRTTIMPRNPVNCLVTHGPYKISRNPMYVSLALFHLGIGIATGNVWHIVTFAPSMLAIRLWVIAPEERYMQSHFNEAYLAYCAKVARWI